MDIHISCRQNQIMCFALNFLQANLDDVSDMLEKVPSEIVGSNIGEDEVESFIKSVGANRY